MVDSLTTGVERLAEEAENLPAFSGVKLLHIKRSVVQMLGQIGGTGIFDTYTRHDVTHIDGMLEIVEWLVPDSTKRIMTPADWLVIVLATYFHDLGMLVTKDEYSKRNTSTFPEFRDKVLFGGDSGTDYRERIRHLPEEEAERFLYQEFVRHHHGQRVRHWIMGEARDSLGVATAVVHEVDTLLSSLDAQLRRDLASVCESHNLDDIEDVRKYKVSQPYGTAAETANLQYAAMLLRTADLLHITRDRTPAVVFRLISPIHPLGHREWGKQRAVRSVRWKLGVNAEGLPDAKAPRDTIEVHASFNDPEGFFSLTSYLAYARAQLRRTHEIAQTSIKRLAARHEFPWRYVDDDSITTEGFLRQSFEFTVDNARILDLLTGHTLYNETSVVLRELIQNAIDAVRLQNHIDRRSAPETQPGSVTIIWNSKTRTLEVQDDGTGMTQRIVEENLLRVGASRYEDPKFKEEHPDFTPISRFGIGILSAFMVADDVDVITSHPEESEARWIVLRSLHGKYLVRLLDKETSAEAKRLGRHGTLIRLRLRPSGKPLNVVEAAQKWIVVPGCQVTVRIDDAPPVAVGFNNAKEALTAEMKRIGYNLDGKPLPGYGTRIEIREAEVDGLDVAFATEWSDYFKEWSFVEVHEGRSLPEQTPTLGTCVHGIRVETGSPGFDKGGILAIANATGPGAPKTNVARTGLGSAEERDRLAKFSYRAYCGHISAELAKMTSERGLSISWAAREANFLISAFSEEDSRSVANRGLLVDAMKEVPAVLFEQGGCRSAVTPSELLKWDHFWTADCNLVRHAEGLITEVSASPSLRGILRSLQVQEADMPREPLVCRSSGDRFLDLCVFPDWEVDDIRIDKEQRRLDLRWSKREESPRWMEVPQADSLRRGLHFRSDTQGFYIPLRDVSVEGVEDEIGVVSLGTLYLFPNTDVSRLVAEAVHERESRPENHSRSNAIIFMIRTALNRPHVTLYPGYLEHAQREAGFHFDDQLKSRLAEILTPGRLKVFNPSAWTRGKSD